MNLQKYLFLLAVLCLMAACQQAPPTGDISEKIKETPVLLDRHEAIQHGSEWENVQNQYGTNRSKILQNENDGNARLALAQVFINEARITGEHGHYYPAALKMLNGILKDGTEDNDLTFRALVIKAGVELSLHNFKDALRTGEKALTLNPYNAQLYGVLADAHVELGEYDSAVEMANRMMSIRPDLRSYARVSYLREIHGDINGAIEAMEMAVQSGHPALEETAWTMLTLGELYQQYGQPNKALTVYEEILVHRPNHPFAIAAIGNVYLEEKKYVGAEKMFKKAMSIIPEVGFYINLSKLYQATSRPEEAKELVEEILAMLQDDLDSGNNMNLELADVHDNLLEDQDMALEYVLKEYKIRPGNIDVNRKLALLYAKMGNLERADFHKSQAARTNSKHPDLLALADLK